MWMCPRSSATSAEAREVKSWIDARTRATRAAADSCSERTAGVRRPSQMAELHRAARGKNVAPRKADQAFFA
jgi:hypothetical protein